VRATLGTSGPFRISDALEEGPVKISRIASIALILTLLAGSACRFPSREGGPAQVAPSAPAKKRLTFEEAVSPRAGGLFRGRLPRIRWASDGVHLERDEDGRTVWVHPLTGESREVPDEKGPRREELRKALEALEEFDEKSAGRAAGIARLGDGEGEPALVDFRDDLYFQRSGLPALRLTRDDDPERDAAMSPDGNFVAFVRGHDLHVVDTTTAETRALTTGGSEDLLFGRLDWVYQEEVYGRGRWKAHWWSPDSRWLAYLRLDESEVHDFTVVDHIPPRLDVEVTRYPKAGDPNPVASLWAVPAEGGDRVQFDLSAYEGEEFLIVDVDWAPDGSAVVFQVQDRIQTWLDLLVGDPATGQVERLFRETSDTWVNLLGSPRWLSDGTFLWASERTGWKHLYRYARDGHLLGAVTTGEWEVRNIVELDEAFGYIWFTASKDGAIDDPVYRVGLDGTGLVCLTPEAGGHSVRLNGDRSLFLDTFSSFDVPPEIRLCDAQGKVLAVLARTSIPALDEYEFVLPEVLRIPARDGVLLDATLLKPPSFDPARRYPVWIPTYSGPNSPQVVNRWDGDPWEQFLAQQGYLVFQVNNRSSSRAGQIATGTCYKRLGIGELEDLIDAVAWLGRNPWADASKVGITGWSYGGFMTAFALLKSDAFALGIAGAGVYDWRLYDTIYTERYMSTPQRNPEGYDATSCLRAAGELHGRLILLHGTMDDNVHLQNTIQLAWELEKAGKPFELMVYPKSRHGVGDPALRAHMRRLVWDAIRTTLPVDPSPDG